MGAHAGLAAQAGKDGCMQCGHGAVNIRVVHSRYGQARCPPDQVLLNRTNGPQVLHIAVVHRLQRHVLGAYLATGIIIPDFPTVGLSLRLVVASRAHPK